MPCGSIPHLNNFKLKTYTMQVQIFDWTFECKDKLAELGFVHQQELDLSHAGFYAVVEKLHNTGMDVMITGGSQRIIYVDRLGKKFRQR